MNQPESPQAAAREAITVRSITPFLSARDIAATVAFYTTRLGFRVAKLHPASSPTLAFLDFVDPATGARTATIIFDSTLWRGEPAMTGQLLLDLGPQRGGPARVLALLDRVRAHAAVEWGPEVFECGRRECSIKDPNGYSLVLSEETDDAPTCRE
jgi:catechol 2,3-dioxygenase-like lactoylglutathione lyase family enzyme